MYIISYTHFIDEVVLEDKQKSFRDYLGPPWVNFYTFHKRRKSSFITKTIKYCLKFNYKLFYLENTKFCQQKNKMESFPRKLTTIEREKLWIVYLQSEILLLYKDSKWNFTLFSLWYTNTYNKRIIVPTLYRSKNV